MWCCFMYAVGFVYMYEDTQIMQLHAHACIRLFAPWVGSTIAWRHPLPSALYSRTRAGT